MQTIKLAAPAKINLTLEVLNKRPDGYHDIRSIMQAISLYDYLTISVKDSQTNVIKLSGTSSEIPYNEKNLVYKAAEKFLNKADISDKEVVFFIEKNIPVEAGLAGGSTDAAAAFYGLNKLFNEPLSPDDMAELCASIGSDLNFCLQGGRALCTGRGENVQAVGSSESFVTLVKPLGFGISAKEAYCKFAQCGDKKTIDYTAKLLADFNEDYLFNSLEAPLLNDYPQLLEIKTKIKGSMMSGSGPTFFVLQKSCPAVFNTNEFLVIENLHFVDDGIKIIN